MPAGAPNDPAADWNGYGGVGDYARSNGNTWEVVNAGHGIRDNMYERAIANATPTGETYDLVIAGGGFAGGHRGVHLCHEKTKRQAPLPDLGESPTDWR